MNRTCKNYLFVFFTLATIMFIMISNPSLLFADQTDATQAFLTAIKKGNSEGVSLLIEEENIDLEYRDELGRTPLILAATLKMNRTNDKSTTNRNSPKPDWLCQDLGFRLVAESR